MLGGQTGAAAGCRLIPLLAVLLLCCGTSPVAGEAVTGTLQIFYQQELNGTAPGQLVALLLQPRPGDVLQIVNYNALRQGGRLPRGAKSGSVLLVTGSRLAGQSTTGAIPFEASELLVVKRARPLKLQAGSGIANTETKAGVDLSTLIIRPRVPANCVSYGRISKNTAEDWRPVYARTNQLMSSCTGGRVSLQTPIVTPYVDIPCTNMSSYTSCEVATVYRWSDDAWAAANAILGINPWAFDHILVDLPELRNCPFWALGTLGGTNIYASGLLSAEALMHEMGHNYGFPHSAKLMLGPNQPLPAGMPVDNAQDDSDIMGYSSGTSCFSVPMLSLLNPPIAGAVTLDPGGWPEGTVRTLTLKPSWADGPQGVVMRTGKAGQELWRVWASYKTSTSSPYSNLLKGPTYDKTVVIHFSSTQWMTWQYGELPFVFRIRVLQSGEIFRWKLTGLTFRFLSVSDDGQSATLQVCRGKPCRLKQVLSQPLATPVRAQQKRLVLPSTWDPFGASWCLRACDTPDCDTLPQPPFTPGRNANLWLTTPCPNTPVASWYSIPHASGYVQWVNVATGKCLHLGTAAGYDHWGTRWWEMKYRLVLAPCLVGQTPDFRSNPQLWEPRPVAGTSPVAYTHSSGMLYPNCDAPPLGCGVDYEVCIEGCGDFFTDGRPQAHCALNIPDSSAGGGPRHTLALGGRCWGGGPQQVVPLQVKRVRRAAASSSGAGA